MADTLLIIEDETLLGNELREHFESDPVASWEVVLATTLTEARRQLFDRRLDPLVVLADLSLPDGNSLDLLEEVRSRRLPGEWVFLTGFGGVPDSVRALRLGAVDFLEKPCELERLDVVVAGACRSARAQRRLQEGAAEAERRYTPDSFLGRSPASRHVRALLARLAEAPFSAVLLTGESGTGKGLVARILHHSGSRSRGPLIEVNCASLPRELLESELFGHEAGAFTGARGRHRGYLERANGGSLFLDEIGELAPGLQAKLLTAVEDQRFTRVGGESETKVDVQILAASNRDLQASVADGSFRKDLYHRLSVFQVDLPPLRARLDDLQDLVPALVDEFNGRARKQVREIPDEVWDALRAHDWPGNVRELRNVVERCVLLSEGTVFPAQWLQLRPAPPRRPEVSGDQLVLPLDGSLSLEDMERLIIRIALERHGGNVTAAARALGATRETLRYRVQKYGLSSSDS